MFSGIQQINESILLALNSLSTNDFIANLVGIFADAPIFFIPIFLIITWIILSYKKEQEKKENLLFILYSCILGIVIALIIQKIVHFDRPENYILHTGKLLLKHIPDASFPSDHATVSFAFLTSLYLSNYKKVFYIFLPFAFIMVISRIIAGVHWPLDIIVGILIGIFSSFIIFKFIKKLEIIKKLNTMIMKITSFVKL
ncbi:MAG: phosphatase PAP2 family protein [Candidatus Gracilibacteria bacterium]